MSDWRSSTFGFYSLLTGDGTGYEGAFKCMKCDGIREVRACNNCGNTEFISSYGEDNRKGIFCMKCRRGFTTWKCVCGCVNPVKDTWVARYKNWPK